ncbi:hypothetical protein M3181_20455 [Mesobacillus maritimus]|uniref:hypothetical protein n=1 Tax=Mesobacillus maritimus TaxID=1643336 RepID=UPI00203BD652|nr:hypothetical protein [Mesobacillus maritimus]MCM3671335.1 hypothetical protein [Mesobacillus maritimus]
MVRLITVSFTFWLLALILGLILDITLTSYGLPMNGFFETLVQLLIIYYGVSRFGFKTINKNN